VPPCFCLGWTGNYCGAAPGSGNNANITIGDVAVVQGDTPGTVAKMQAIVIGQAPPAGEGRSLPGEYIRTRLKQHGFTAEDFDLQVPSRVEITRASQRLNPRELESAVVRAIMARMPWQSQQVTIRDLRGLEAVNLPPGPVEYDVTFASQSDFLGLTSFTLILRVSGRAEERLHGTAYIEVTQEVVATVRQLSRNEVIGVHAVRLMRVQMEQRPRQIITRLEDVVGKRARHSLQANAAISPLEIEGAPLVQKGDAVLIVLESPLLKVTAVGVALEQGLRGETIRIKNTTSNRELRAVVVDTKTVRVPF
jgi:flagellar basal body P-ring formation protein FlgA